MAEVLPPPPDSGSHFRDFTIPEELPSILRAFAKAAIKEQPEDINRWAHKYFSELHILKDRPPSARLPDDNPGMN